MESAECVVEKRWGPEQSMVNSGKNNFHKVYCKELPRNEVVTKWVNRNCFQICWPSNFYNIWQTSFISWWGTSSRKEPPTYPPPPKKKDLRGNSGPWRIFFFLKRPKGNGIRPKNVWNFDRSRDFITDASRLMNLVVRL